MSWIASASTFLDQLDTTAAVAKQEGVVPTLTAVVDGEAPLGPVTEASIAKAAAVDLTATPPRRFKPPPETNSPSTPVSLSAAQKESDEASSETAKNQELGENMDAAVPTPLMTVAASVDTQAPVSSAGNPVEAPQTLTPALSDEIRSLREGNARMKAEHAAAVQGYEANLDEFAADNEKLRASAQLLKTQLSAAREALGAHNEKLLKAAAEKSAAVEAKSTEVEGISSELQTAKQSEQEAWRQVTVLTEERDALKSAATVAQEEAHQREQVERTAREATANQALAQQRQAAEQARKEAAALSQQLAAAEAESVRSSRLLASTQKSLEVRNEAYAELAPRNRELTKRVNELEAELSALRTKYEGAEAAALEAASTAEAASSAQAAAEAKVASLEEQLEELETAAAAHAQDRKTMTASAAYPQRDTEHTKALEARLSNLESHLAQKEAALAKVSSERTALQLELDKALREPATLAAIGSSPTTLEWGGVSEGWDQGSTESVGISRLRGRRRMEQSAADREERLSDTPLFARGRETGILSTGPKGKGLGPAPTSKAMSTAAVIFDNVSLGAIRILRRHSFVRLLLLLYLIWLHTWALFVLEWAVDLEEEDIADKVQAFKQGQALGVGSPDGAALAGADGLLPADERH